MWPLPKHSLTAILLGLLVNVQIAVSDWDFAVTSNDGIIFYDAAWQRMFAFNDDFDDIQAIAHDGVTNTVFFNDKVHESGSIFSLQLRNGTQKTVGKLVHKSKNEHIGGIAFDSLERMLYWTDSAKKKIFRMPVGSSNEIVPGNVTEWRSTKFMPLAIAIDVCRRRIYWTSRNNDATDDPSIVHMAEMNGTGEKDIVRGYMILGLTVDQFSRKLFWVDDTQGTNFQVGSSNLDGTNETVAYQGLNNQPRNVAVDSEFVYWTDSTNKKVWKVATNETNHSHSSEVQTFQQEPHSILIRQNVNVSQLTNGECREVYKKIQIKSEELTKPVTPAHSKLQTQERCNNTIPLCHNYCLRGSCRLEFGQPKCDCPAGYSGDRCEQDECFTYCLNGHCLVELDKLAPVCKTKICERFCVPENKLGSPDQLAFCGCGVSTDNDTTTSPVVSGTMDKLTTSPECPSENPNGMIVLISVVVLVSLCLVLLIVVCARRIYKPLRPRIKKTFVVRNKMDRKNKTPLTCRPVAEQCEITIEDCCNMNICDTPCFDPETMHEEIKKERSRKEDKYNLLSNIDGDLY